MKNCKKVFCLFFIFISLFFVGKTNVFAFDFWGESDEEFDHLPEAKVEDNDYTITCVYHNGLIVTVSKTSITLVRASNEPHETNANVILFFKRDEINRRDPSTGKITRYQTGNFLTSKGMCPKKLYAYYVEEGAGEDVESDKTSGSILEDVSNYAYSTDSNLTTDDTGKDTSFWGDVELLERGEDEEARDTYLVSESAELITTKKVPICDYSVDIKKEVVSTDLEEPAGDKVAKATLSLYLFKNLTFATLGNYTAVVSEAVPKCPNKESTEKLLYINNPQPENQVINNAPSLLTSYSGIKRFYISDNQNDCYDENDNKACAAFKFLGERNGGDEDSKNKLCEKLGNELVTIIQDIVATMQIVVPGLVIILTGIDIGKLVVSGNLDEELPKKKKTIIIRIIVMAIFFFLPTLTDLIIKLLKDADLIGVEYVECIFLPK